LFDSRPIVSTPNTFYLELGNQEFLKAFPGVEINSNAKTRENLDTDGRKYVADTIKDFATKEQRAEELFKRLRDQKSLHCFKLYKRLWSKRSCARVSFSRLVFKFECGRDSLAERSTGNFIESA